MDEKHVLLITCTIGYGHDAAAQNISNRLKQDNPSIQIHTVDTANFLYPLKQYTAVLWNQSVRKGRAMMSFMEWVESYYEKFYNRFLKHFLQKHLSALFSEYAIDTIYDTQPLFTPIIQEAFVNAYPEQTLYYHKIFTDLPTKDAQHFFSSIRQLKEYPSLIFKVHACQPYLEESETVESFWSKHCHISHTAIDANYALPVNEHYLTQPENINHITVELDAPWPQQYNLSLQNNSITIEPDAHVCTLMLGSQGVDAVYDYCQAYLEQMKDKGSTTPHYFMIACARNENLYQRIATLITQTQTNNHIILPLKMQSLENIASLMWRSNTVIIRSGGLSCIEQIALRQQHTQPPKLFIHAPSNTHQSA